MLDLLFYLGYYAKYCFIFNESIYAEIVTTIMGFQKEAYHVTKFVDKRYSLRLSFSSSKQFATSNPT